MAAVVDKLITQLANLCSKFYEAVALGSIFRKGLSFDAVFAYLNIFIQNLSKLSAVIHSLAQENSDTICA